MKSSIIVSLLVLAVVANAYGPSVNQTNTLSSVFVKQNELFSADLSNYFSGYNITYTTNSTSVTVQPALSLLAAGPFATSNATDIPSIIFQSVPKTDAGNIDYSGYYLYLTDDSYLYWANTTSEVSAPQMVGGFQVTNLKNVQCYGADQITSDLLIVDCALTDSVAGQQTDIFFYVNATLKQVIGNYSAPANANTTFNKAALTIPRGVRTLDLGNGNHYIFRFVGGAAFTNPAYVNTSYVEVYKAFNWIQPAAYKLFDAKFVNASSLNIIGFEILNENLFILDADYIYLLQSDGVEFTPSAVDSFQLLLVRAPTGISVGLEYYDNQPVLTVLVYSVSYAYEVDWTTIGSATVRVAYNLPQDLFVFKADFSENYVYLQGASPDGTALLNFARGSRFLQLQSSVPLNKSANVNWWSVDRAFDNVFLWDQTISEVHNFHYQRKLLNVNSATVSDGVVQVNATSYGSDGTNQTATTTFYYSAIADTNFSLFLNTSSVNLTLEYPSPFTVSLDDVVYGPGINYNLNNGSLLTNFTLQSYDTVSINFPSTFKPTTIYYQKSLPDVNNPGKFLGFIQIDNFVLYSLSCSDSINPTTLKITLDCSTIIGTATLKAAISSMVVLSNYSALITTDHPDVVQFFDTTLKPVVSFSTGDPAINACADLVVLPSGSYIACSQKVAKRIVLWDADHPENETQIVIDRSYLPESRYPIFSPSNLAVSQNYPDSLFVKNDVGVLVINLGPLQTANLVAVSANIALPANLLAGASYDFIVNANSILFFIYQNATSTLLQEYSLTLDTINTPLLKKYSQFLPYTYQSGAATHYSSSSTNRFFSAVTDSNSNPQIAAFKSESSANNNFLQSFNLGWTGVTNVFLSGAHASIVNADYVIVVSNNAKVQAYVVYEHTSFTSNSYLQSRQNSQESTNFSINASTTLAGNSSVNVPFNVLTFNSDPPVTPGKLANDTNALNLIDFTSNKTSFTFNPSDFFNGIITSWQLTPENANDTGKLNLQIPIGSPSTAFTSPLTVVDLTITKAVTYAQTKDRLIRLDSANLSTILTITDMGSGFTPGALKCEGVLADDTNPYSTSFCRDMSNSSTGYFITVSYIGSTPYVLTPVWTPLTSLACMRNIGSYVIMLENPNGQVATPGSKLHVFNFANPAFPVYGGYIDGSFFGASSFQVGRWDIVPLSTNYYRIYLADGRFGVRTVEWNYTTNKFSNPQSVNLINNAGILADNLPATSIFLGISCLQFNAATNDTNIALTTDTYNSYYVKLSFDPNNGTITATVQAVYKKLSAATNLAKITATTFNGYTFFAVSSYNPNTQEGFVTVYNGTSADQATQIKAINYPAAATGNIAFSLFQGSTNAKFWVYTPANTNISAVHDSVNQSSVQSFDVTPFYEINVVPGSNLSSKYVNLTGYTDQNSLTISFSVTYAPGPNPPGPNPKPDDKGSSKWWIWLIVGLGILVIGVAIFAFVRYRQKKQSAAEDDVNAPLATNYA